MFGARLKELRKKNGYTQVTLAGKLGVSKGTVAMWEVGKGNLILKRYVHYQNYLMLGLIIYWDNQMMIHQSPFLIRILNSLGRGLQRKASKNFLSYILLLILTAKIR